MVVFSQQPFSFDGIKPWLYIWTMKTTLSERLKEARLARGLTQKALGDLVGVSQAAIQKIETGKANQTTKIVEIANALGVRAEWLSSGVGNMSDSTVQPIQSTVSHSKYFKIDVLDIEVSAGPGVINREFVEVLRSVEYSFDDARHMFDGRKAENIRIINVRGDSMSGTIDTAHVKRLQMMKDKLLVISDNKSYSPWDPIEKDEMNRVFIFGKVIGSMPQTYRKHG